MLDKTAVIRYQLWTIAVGFFMQSLDTTIINTALPSIARSLQQNPLEMHSIIVCYVLTMAVVLPASGWIADRVGIKWTFFGAIILFTLGSVCCAASGTLYQLQLSRVIQGVGGAMMVPIGRLAVLKLVPREQYLAAMTLVTLPGQIGPLLGPTLGGFLVEVASWHWIFLINIPMGAVGLWITWRYLPDARSENRQSFDIFGFMLLASMMLTTIIALNHFSFLPFFSFKVAGLLLLALICVLTYYWYARKIPSALFPLKLWQLVPYRQGAIASLLCRTGSAMLPFMTPLFLQINLGYSPLQAGLLMIPMVVGSMGMKKLIVKVVEHYGYLTILVVATVALTLVTAALPLVTQITTAFWPILLLLFIQGMVNSLRFSCLNSYTLQTLPAALASSGNTLLAMVMQLSMSLGVTLAGLLLSFWQHSSLLYAANSLHQQFLYCYFSMAVIILLPILLFNSMRKQQTV